METDLFIWHPAPGGLLPNHQVVQLWCCDLDDAGIRVFCDEAALAAEEVEQAERLRFPRKQVLFRRRRALGRFLLGQYLQQSARLLRFAESVTGELILTHPEKPHCHFNTSHSENIFVMAITEAAEVGVDIEAMGPEWDWQGVAEAYLDSDRLAQLKAVRDVDGQEAFLRFWSLREAFAKACGEGVARESAEGIPSEKVWDIMFDPTGSEAAAVRCAWQWTLRREKIGTREAVVAVALRRPTPTK